VIGLKSLAIITDSCADLTVEVAQKHGIVVVPLTVTIDDRSWVDGELSQAEFFERMNAAPSLPTTSQPSVGAFVEAYREALETATEVVSVHISSKLSGTISSARQAAEQFAGRVHIVDTLNLSWGQGLQVLEAAKAAAEGLDARAVVERVERARDRAQLLVGLDGFEVEDKMGGAKRGVFAVMHAMAPDRADWLERAIRERFEPIELYLVEVGVVIATHTGTGWGVAFLPEE